MEIKNCAHCGHKGLPKTAHPGCDSGFVHCHCGIKTDIFPSLAEAIDVWNARHETNPSEADRWLNEAIEQRARADKSEEMVAFLKEQLARVANFNCDWDMLKACQESWRELAAEHNKLKKEYDQLTEALEQAKRMLDYAGKLQ